MPITVNAAWDLKTDTTKVEYQGETATIVFLPNRITPKLVKKVQADGGNIDVLCKALVLIVHSWDVMGSPQQSDLDDDGDVDVFDDEQTTAVYANANHENDTRPYPLEFNALRALPLPFLSVVTESVFSAAVPNSRKTGGK